ncbi:MAG: hypothetical protein WD929_03405 [Steroidobacteraceae bacterium]
MPVPSQFSSRALGFALAVVLAVTRSGHFGSISMPPDATLAVFFLAGAFIASAWLVPLLLFEAALVDYLAITVGGVSSYCVTPAYLFLIPTYAALWWAGRWYGRRLKVNGYAIVVLAFAVVVGTTAAFLISNGSFYALSGYFTALSLTTYATRVAQYYPPYVGWTAFYAGLGVAALRWLAHAKSSQRQEAASK